jgi:hypothetical protein
MAAPTDAAQDWPAADGGKVSCREKLKVLQENQAELAQMAQDAFEDALLMGVDEAALRARLHAMVDALVRPGARHR